MGEMQTPRGNLSVNNSDPTTLRIEGLDIGRPFPKYSYLKRLHYEWDFGRKLAGIIEQEAPDVFIASNMSPDRLAAAIKLCRKKNIPIVIWLQDIYSHAIQHLLSKKYFGMGWFIGRYYLIKEKRQLSQADHTVLITEDFMDFARSSGLVEDEITVQHNWAPLDELPVASRLNDWAQEQKLVDKFVFLYAGTLGLKHNPALLAQLAERFSDQPEVIIAVISEGLGAEWLQKAKTERKLTNLLLLPFQPFEALPEVLASADVLLTLLEDSAGVFSVPSKILTYLCAGRPILMAGPTINLGARIIQQEKAGMVCEAKEATTFCELAATLYEDVGLRKEQALHARAYAEKTFNIVRIADRFESIIETTIRRKR